MGWRETLLAASAALLVLGGSPASADADAGHDYSYSFEAGTDVRDIAVDNSGGPAAGAVYVADNGRVVRYTPAGETVWSFVTGAIPTSLAVDDSHGPSAGALYVGETHPDRIIKIDPSGQRVVAWGEAGEVLTGPINGVATDTLGRLSVLVLDTHGEPAEWRLVVYDEAGVEVSRTTVPSPPYVKSLEGIDTFGLSYFRTYQGIGRWDGASPELELFPATYYAQGFALDRADEALYIAEDDGSVTRIEANCDSDCGPPTNSGAGYIAPIHADRAIAVDAGSKTVYVADRPHPSYFGLTEVAVFRPPGLLPDAETGSADPTGEQTATAAGFVDLEGAGQVTDCHFEYAAGDRYGSVGFGTAQSAPCQQGLPFASATAVSADLTGMTAGTTYYYRLVASNSAGPARGKVESFMTTTRPRAITLESRGVGESAATVYGIVHSGLGDPVEDCHFEYRIEPGSGASDPKVLEVPCAPSVPYLEKVSTPVSANLAGLTPGTDYEYELVASSESGVSLGGSRNFTTNLRIRPREPTPPDPEEPEEGEEGHRSKPVRCSERSCTKLLEGASRAQVWTSPKFPAEFGWLFDVLRDGRPLHHSDLRDGCSVTFRGRGVTAELNACPNRFRLTYRGPGGLKVRWRVFEFCRCEKVGGRGGRG